MVEITTQLQALIQLRKKNNKMKKIGLISFFSLASLLAGKTLYKCMPASEMQRVLVLVINTNDDDAVAFTNSEFWYYKADFDTIDVKGKSILKTLDTLFSKMKEVNWYPNDPSTEFEHGSAFIRYYKNYQDTIYSDSRFRDWKKGTTIYTDCTGKLEVLFKNFKVY
jgi:hypothetical protein